MNFLDILRGKKNASAADIAVEIIKLEKRIPEYEAAEQQTEEALLELRQAKIAGETVGGNKIEEAEKKYETIRQERKALRISIDGLIRRLHEAAAQQIQEGKAAIEQRRKALSDQRKKVTKEYILLYVRAKVLQIALIGPEATYSPLGADFQGEQNDFYNAELKSAMAAYKEDPESMIWELAHRLEADFIELKGKTAEQLAEELLQQAKDQDKKSAGE
jgi:hypothetical protein